MANPTIYQSVVTATNYDATAGKKGCKYDGIDDGMATASVDFTATDSMSVSVGVQKTSDAARAVFAELGNALAAEVFVLEAPSSSLNNYAYRSAGTILSTSVASGYSSPIPNVVTGLADISGDVNKIRVNGVEIASTATDQGTGNYGNYPLYFGRRGGASLPFTGVEHNTTIINRPFTASELTNIERFNATKTGVTI